MKRFRDAGCAPSKQNFDSKNVCKSVRTSWLGPFREALKKADLRRSAPICADLRRSAPICADLRRSVPICADLRRSAPICADQENFFCTTNKNCNVFLAQKQCLFINPDEINYFEFVFSSKWNNKYRAKNGSRLEIFQKHACWSIFDNFMIIF